MLTARFGRALTRPCFRRLAASLVLTATAPTMAGAQVAPQPGATPAQMMERVCADHDAHFAGANGIPRSQIGLEAAQRSASEAFVGAMRRGRKADPRYVPIAAAGLGRRSRSTARSIGSPGDCARSDAGGAACRCCAPQERAGVGPATPAGGGDLAAGPLAAARSARTTRRRSTKPPARLWTLASAAAAAVNRYRHPWRIC